MKREGWIDAQPANDTTHFVLSERESKAIAEKYKRMEEALQKFTSPMTHVSQDCGSIKSGDCKCGLSDAVAALSFDPLSE